LQGEIIFLSGGNGSGKSTLVKVLTGLYFPTSGFIKVNGTVISFDLIQEYRHLFSVVYTDNYLFDKIFGLEENEDNRMTEILEDLFLVSKVKFSDSAFSTTDLSFGQRKRLSLATCLLEDRQIYVFDELAANQDFEFKEYFYNNILKKLSNQGKIVFVITHDEKYFHIADKHFKMEMGKLMNYTV
jgi:putative pyoverdin transport system ATP-binding/permease protein